MAANSPYYGKNIAISLPPQKHFNPCSIFQGMYSSPSVLASPSLEVQAVLCPTLSHSSTTSHSTRALALSPRLGSAMKSNSSRSWSSLRGRTAKNGRAKIYSLYIYEVCFRPWRPHDHYPLCVMYTALLLKTSGGSATCKQGHRIPAVFCDAASLR